MEERIINTRTNIISTLETMASGKKMKSYKKAVPFVIISLELYAQWDSIKYMHKKIWFEQVFNTEELKLILEFDKEFRKVFNRIENDILYDLSSLLNDSNWKIIQNKALVLLSNLHIKN